MSLQTNNRLLADNKITAIYLRLSHEDTTAGDSDSIVNQRTMLLKYCADKGYTNVQEFCDDGYSGISFQRPGFQKMLEHIEAGKVGTVVVKDLSRLGRDYIQMGYFTEMIFPRYQINFIAVQDGVEGKSNNDYTAFRFVCNDFHVRDTSKKVRAIKDMQAQSGQRVNGALTPFGYKYDGEKLIIDPETAPIIKRIFDLCASGKGPAQIARQLTEEKVITPYGYKGYSTGKEVNYPERWSETTVGKMLERKEYIGHTVNKKSYVTSYKDKKRIFNSEDDMLIFYNTHQPIIDVETFELVQNIRKNKKRTTKMGEQPIFSGLLFCADCGKAEYFFRGTTIDESQYSYNCGNYRGKARSCTPHGIRLVVLEKLVLEHIRMVTSYVTENEQSFAEKLMQKSMQNQKSDLAKKKRDAEKAKRRVLELDKLFSKLYEDRTLGSLSEERYLKMTAAYEQEQAELNALIQSAEQEISESVDTKSGIDKFIKIARKYLNLQELDGTILRELIEKIVVHEKVKQDGKTSQQIDIYYNFVGIVEPE